MDNGCAGIRFATSILRIVMALLASIALFVGLHRPGLGASIERLSRASGVRQEFAHLSEDASDIETGGRGRLLKRARPV